MCYNHLVITAELHFYSSFQRYPTCHYWSHMARWPDGHKWPLWPSLPVVIVRGGGCLSGGCLLKPYLGSETVCYGSKQTNGFLFTPALFLRVILKMAALQYFRHSDINGLNKRIFHLLFSFFPFVCFFIIITFVD